MTVHSLERVDHHQSTFPKAPYRWMNSVGIAVALAIAYFLAARLSLYLLTEPDGVAVFWPAAGVSAGVLIALGSRARLPVIAGTMAATIAANILGDRNIWGAIVFAACNAAEALLVATLIQRYFGSSFNLEKPRQVIGLLAATVVGTAISGVGGTVGFELFHSSRAPILTIWHHWFASDALGIITVAPLLIGLTQAVHDPPPRSEIFEGVLILMLLALVSGLIVLLPRELWVAVVPTTLLFPLLLWVTARCRPVFAAAAAFILALTVVSTTTFGIGILGDPMLPVAQRILCAQAGLLTASLCALILAALFAERRTNEARLAHSNIMLERERDNKLMNVQAATATMAHEAKQPLAVISLKGEAAQQLLKQTKPDLEKVRSALVSIVSNSHRASQILNSTRALFARTDKGHESIDVNKIAQQAVRLLREQLKTQGITAHVELTSDLPLVLGHKGQLQEVIINLLQNAIEAMSAVHNGRGRMLQLRTRRDGDDAIIVEVEDSGPGIDPADLNNIFDAFFTRKSHGMGLGLAICRMIIERHGGRLSALSDGMNGALFRVILPARNVHAGNASIVRADKQPIAAK
ncbi:MAG TPA: MASE1 domain-containing protein [Pseudolabrys sp.]|nr:MASE1 domain-containing protein [Pseudolabrys sp.]